MKPSHGRRESPDPQNESPAEAGLRDLRTVGGSGRHGKAGSRAAALPAAPRLGFGGMTALQDSQPLDMPGRPRHDTHLVGGNVAMNRLHELLNLRTRQHVDQVLFDRAYRARLSRNEAWSTHLFRHASDRGGGGGGGMLALPAGGGAGGGPPA